MVRAVGTSLGLAPRSWYRGCILLSLSSPIRDKYLSNRAPTRRNFRKDESNDDDEHRGTTVSLKRSLALGVVFLGSGTLTSPLFGAEQILACTNLVSQFKWQIKIDFAASTVDSNPAQISSAEISWHDATDGGNYTLDRKSGALTVIFPSSTGGYFIHDRCSPQN